MSGSHRQGAFEAASKLQQVHGEIDARLLRAHDAVSQGLERGDPAIGNIAADELRRVDSSLAEAKCFGASLLAQESVSLLEGLVAGKTQHPAEAGAALSGALLQLSDYVELLAQGAPDRVLVLQPVLNELRMAGGQPLLTEARLFVRQLQAQESASMLAGALRNSDAAQALAKRELLAFQTAFLYWFRGQQIDAALERIGQIAESVARSAQAQPLREFWSNCAALTHCLQLQAEDSLDLKRLFGLAASQLKLLADAGEAAALAQLGDAPQRMLFHIARAPSPGPEASALISGLHLDILLPSAAERADLQRKLRGPDSMILNRFCAGLRDDFDRLKTAIDRTMHADKCSDADLGGARERLQRVAQNVGTLGLPYAQQALLNQSFSVADSKPGATHWAAAAITILRVEHSLEEALFCTFSRSGDASPRDVAGSERNAAIETTPREAPAPLARDGRIEIAQSQTFDRRATQALETLDRHQNWWAAGDPTAVPDLLQGLRDFEDLALVEGAVAIGNAVRQLEQALQRLEPDFEAPVQSRIAKGIERLRRLLGKHARGESLDADEAFA